MKLIAIGLYDIMYTQEEKKAVSDTWKEELNEDLHHL